jgi:hypothetical protein
MKSTYILKKLHFAILHFLVLCFLIADFQILNAQNAFVPLNSNSEFLLQRYEIKSGKHRQGLFSDIRPYSQNQIPSLIRNYDSTSKPLSRTDLFNIEYIKEDNQTGKTTNIKSANKKFFSNFYRTPANFFQVNEPDFNLYVNPGLNLMAAYSNRNDKPLYTNTRSIEVRGNIADKVGFYAFVSENQMRPPDHEFAYFEEWEAYPGAHLTKSFKTDGVDFFLSKGYITFSPVKPITIQFGQDRNFIGNGIQSLLLSDFATDYLFLKINTRVWHINYMNLFAKLSDRYGSVTGINTSRPYPAKYLALHYLSIDILKNLNLGFYESVIFHDNTGTGRGFDPYYLNPIIFYRSVEHQLGDADKMIVGLNLGYIPFRNVKLYGQFMLNEFRIADLRARNGHFANKYGFQTGIKYIDAFKISNLDAQAEYNRVRPYSYTHYSLSDTYPVNSFSHSNQPLAHPLGANFSEIIFKLDYQPLPRLTSGLILTVTNYGADSSNSNWGGNIFLDYRDYEQELGNVVGQGVKTQLQILETWVSYQIRHNYYIDLTLRYRNLTSEIDDRNKSNLFIGTSLRINLYRSRWVF